MVAFYLLPVNSNWGQVQMKWGDKMSRLIVRISIIGVVICSVLAVVIGNRSMQGTGKRIDEDHLVCTLKHYAAHGSPECGINIGPVAGGIRDLRSIYLPPFETVLKEAGALSVMPAYSEYDGVPATASNTRTTEVPIDPL